MAIRDWFRRTEQRNAHESDDTSSSNFWMGQRIAVGVDQVTSPEHAMKIAAAYRCIDILSKEVALLPLEVLRNQGGYFRRDEGNPLNYLMAVRPNLRQNAYDLFRNAIVQYLTHGNAVILPVIGTYGVEQLILFSPNSVQYDKYKNVYRVNDIVNGISGTYEAGQLIHLKNLSLDGGYWGASTIEFAATSLAIASNADIQNVDTFKNGGTVRGFVSGNSAQTMGFGALQDKQLSGVADSIETQINSGKAIFALPGEMKFNQVSLSAKDIELLGTKQFTVVDVCRFFGVHPDKVFAQQTANYKASEMSQVAFLTDTLQPLLHQIECEFQAKLIPQSMYDVQRIAFNLDNLMQTDLATKAAYIEKTIATGTYTVNYWRMKNGQEPVKGGDEPLVSANLLPLDSAKLRGEPSGAPGA